MAILTGKYNTIQAPWFFFLFYFFFQRMYINVRNIEEQKMEVYHKTDISFL